MFRHVERCCPSRLRGHIHLEIIAAALAPHQGEQRMRTSSLRSSSFRRRGAATSWMISGFPFWSRRLPGRRDCARPRDRGGGSSCGNISCTGVPQQLPQSIEEALTAGLNQFVRHTSLLRRLNRRDVVEGELGPMGIRAPTQGCSEDERTRATRRYASERSSRRVAPSAIKCLSHTLRAAVVRPETATVRRGQD